MNRTWIVACIIITLAGALFWLIRGRTVVVDLQGQELAAVVDLSCFHPLKPGMRRSEVRSLAGEPERVHVTDMEYDENGDVEYQEIRWVFPRTGGVLAYYIGEYDTPDGSVEYVPKDMSIEDLFIARVSIGLGKRFIEIRDQGRCLFVARLGSGSSIERINWYWKE